MTEGKTFSLFCALLAGTAFLAPFLYSFGFCHSRGDDYDGITRAMFIFDLPGAIYELFREWLTWSGRYTYHFLAVFLGKAAESPLRYGLVCASITFLYALAFFKLARLCLSGKAMPAAFSLAALCALLAFHGHLQDFYLLTDALTIILQAACYFLFLASLLQLWGDHLAERAGKGCKVCIFWGVVAIGVYEHAALATFWTISLALLATKLAAVKKMLPEDGKSLRKALFTCFLWLGCALIFSFLAPGNMARKKARNVVQDQVQDQLFNIPSDCLLFFKAFLLSPWPLAAFGLAMLLRHGSSGKIFHSLPGWLFFLLCPAFFLLFSFSVATLHALSDVPLLSEAKLGASLEVYAAAALCMLIYFWPARKHPHVPVRCLPVFLSCAILVGMMLWSANFLDSAKNAANGQMLLYADFMAERKDWLAREARKSAMTSDKFGLWGEIQNPDARRRKARPERGEVLVQTFPRAVFPVHMGPGLSADPAGWPNLWAAWVYSTGSLAGLPPNPQNAIEAVKRGECSPLSLAKELRDMGLAEAWLVLDRSDPNPTFHNSWLVLKALTALKLKLLLPSVPDSWRLMPHMLQTKAAELFESVSVYKEGMFTNFFALAMETRLEGRGDLNAIWLGPLCKGAPLPHNIFARGKDLLYYKIKESDFLLKEER